MRRCHRCSKVSYASHLAVRKAILLQWKKFPTRRLWFYECPDDPKIWHLTSQDRPTSRR